MNLKNSTIYTIEFDSIMVKNYNLSKFIAIIYGKPSFRVIFCFLMFFHIEIVYLRNPVRSTRQKLSKLKPLDYFRLNFKLLTKRQSFEPKNCFHSKKTVQFFKNHFNYLRGKLLTLI